MLRITCNLFPLARFSVQNSECLSYLLWNYKQGGDRSTWSTQVILILGVEPVDKVESKRVSLFSFENTAFRRKALTRRIQQCVIGKTI